MKIVILDDYQDVVRKLQCATKLEPYQAKVYTNTIKGQGQLAVRLKDAEVLVLIRERTHMPRQLIEKLPKLKLIVQTGRVGSHSDVALAAVRRECQAWRLATVGVESELDAGQFWLGHGA